MGSDTGPDAGAAAEALLAEVDALPAATTSALRALRRSLSTRWRSQAPEFIMGVAGELQLRHVRRWLGYELIRYHRPAFTSLNDARLRELSRGLDSWDVVDAFARIVSGPAWVRGQVSDALIHRWASSRDRWKRRTALVSTVALNMKADGGGGDPERTLAVCGPLACDRDDMVEKALSWALRALAVCDSAAVQHFLATEDARLAARVKREVRNKLETGLKNKRRTASKRRAAIGKS
jgi:3-methyladenine DNA glycosylase AlkD